MVGYFAEHSLFVKIKYNILFVQSSKAQKTDENMIFIGDPLAVHIDKKDSCWEHSYN